jgi:hypothetical protein
VLSFGYFSLHKQRKVTGMSGHPDDLDLKTQKKSQPPTPAKTQRIKTPQTQKNPLTKITGFQ